MRKMIALLMALLMALPMLSAAVAEGTGLAVEPAPDLTALEIIIDSQNPLKVQFVGLFETDGEIGGQTRRLYQYLPASLGYRQPLAMVAMPSGSDPAAFIKESHWQDIADKYGMTVVLAEAGEGGWQADESEYMAFVSKYMDNRAYYICQDAAFYLIGYGDASEAVMDEVVAHADLYAGAAVFALDDYDASILDTVAQTESAKAGVMQSEVALPVWIGAQERTESVAALIDYWKNADEATEGPLSDAYATEIYQYPAYMANTSELVYAHVSRVYVTIGEFDPMDGEFIEHVYADFLRRVRRQDSGDINALRWFVTNAELGMDYHTLEVNGVTREFYVYVPTAFRGETDAALPLVVAFHGGGGSGEEFGTRTAWYKVAEEKGFICVFPTGSRRYVSIQANNFTPRSGWSAADLPFFKAMYDFLLENYPVDATRVYTTGQSQGSMMSQEVVGAYPELLAAATACSTFTDFAAAEVTNPDVKLPMMWSIGMKDKYGPYSEERDAEIMGLMEYWIARNGAERKFTYTDGNNLIYEYLTGDGIPMMRFQWVQEKVHANIPTECYDFYAFMAQWSRGADGALYYMGVQVTAE